MSRNVHLVGVRETLLAMTEVPKALRRKHLRVALSKGGGMLKTAASGHAAVETGLLRRSLRVKVTVPHDDKRAYAVIGPARNAGKFVRRTARGLRGHGKAQKSFLETVKLARGIGAGQREATRAGKAFVGQKFSDATFRNPSRYAHLVEKGTRRSKAKPFLSVAARTTGWAAQDAVIRKLRAGLNEEARLAYARRGVP